MLKPIAFGRGLWWASLGLTWCILASFSTIAPAAQPVPETASAHAQLELLVLGSGSPGATGRAATS